MKDFIYGILIIVVGYFTFYYGKSTVKQPEKIYIEKFLPNPYKYTPPAKEYVYLPYPVEHTRVDTIRIPEKITEYKILPYNGVKLGKSSFTLQLYDPVLNRFVENEYNYKQPLWSQNVTSSLLYSLPQRSIGIALDYTLWYKNIGISAFGVYVPQNELVGLQIKYRF